MVSVAQMSRAYQMGMMDTPDMQVRPWGPREARGGTGALPQVIAGATEKNLQDTLWLPVSPVPHATELIS